MKFSAAVALFGVAVNALPKADVAPRAAATYQATVGSYKHVACQTDPKSNARTLTGKSHSSSSMTPATCMSFCSGWKYFGVEWGIQCFCGNSLASTSSAVAQSQCNQACSGSSALTCGAGSRLDLYMLVATTSTSRSSTSTTTSRASTSSTTSKSSTVATTSRSSTSSTSSRSSSSSTTTRTSTTSTTSVSSTPSTTSTTTRTSSTSTASVSSTPSTTTRTSTTSTTSVSSTPSTTSTTIRTSTTSTISVTSTSSTTSTTTGQSTTSTTSRSSTSTTTTISSTVYPAIAAPSPTAFGTTTSCGKWYTIISTDTCASIQSAWAISFDTLRVMNPYINNQCNNLIVGDSLCVVAANAPSVSTSTRSTTSAASPTPTANNGKRGLCYNDPSLTSSFVGPNSQVSWGYNWGSWVNQSFPTAYEAVPMLWSDSADLTSVWFENVELAIARGTTHLLSFNEPDLYSQANMTPKAAAEAYMTWIQPFAGRVKLGAPAITNGAAPMGLAWMGQFMGNCTACTIDFVPIHWYDQAWNHYYFKGYIQSVYAQVQKPVWITEFNGAGSQDDQSAFLKLVMPWLDSLSYIQRYAWFWAADGYLLSTGTTLSETGVTFNNYTNSTVDPYFTS